MTPAYRLFLLRTCSIACGDMNRVHCVISGDVQGVGFRAFVREHSRRLGLTGWVKNRDDWSVLVVAEGQQEKLEKLISACLAKRDPASQGIKKVNVTWEAATNDFVSFDIVY